MDDAVVEEVVVEEDGGRVEDVGFSVVAEGLEQDEPGLLGAGFLFGLFSEAAPGDAPPG